MQDHHYLLSFSAPPRSLSREATTQKYNSTLRSSHLEHSILTHPLSPRTQARTTSSSEVIFSFEVGGGGSAAHNTDSDVSALLDPSDNSRLRDSAYFSLTLTPPSTQLTSIEYVQPVDDTDDSAGIMLTAADASITKTGDVLKVRVELVFAELVLDLRKIQL